MCSFAKSPYALIYRGNDKKYRKNAGGPTSYFLGCSPVNPVCQEATEPAAWTWAALLRKELLVVLYYR
jgi:hypothetical protein